MIQLPDDSPLPLYQQLYQQIRAQIRSGYLPAGTRLPSRRKLAERLCISVNTVDAAYVQLEAEGFIQAQPRRGFFVLETGLSPEIARKPEVFSASHMESGESSILVDFSPSGIAQDRFPVRIWRQKIRTCLNEYDTNLLRQTPPQGDYGLRCCVADYLYHARGVQCTPEQIVIGAGTDNLLNILGFILPTDYMLCAENPLYNQTNRLFARLGHPVCPVDVDTDGILLEQLPDRNQLIIYTTPSHQYPLGFAMPIRRRTALLHWCNAGEERYVIEDDYDSEFRYESRPIPSLQSIDTTGRVIYLGTFSRSISPALRISYMVLPEALLSLYHRNYAGFSSTVSGFEQAVLREFMRDGSFDTQINRMRSWYRARRQCLLHGLAEITPRPELLGVPAGHHLTLRMHNGMNSDTLVAAAAREGVRVYPVSSYFCSAVPQAYESTILLGFGGLNDEQIRKGCGILSKVWR